MEWATAAFADLLGTRLQCAAFGYMGDYIANVSDGSHQYFAWGDNRNRVTNFLYPNGRADPDVFFAKQ